MSESVQSPDREDSLGRMVTAGQPVTLAARSLLREEGRAMAGAAAAPVDMQALWVSLDPFGFPKGVARAVGVEGGPGTLGGAAGELTPCLLLSGGMRHLRMRLAEYRRVADRVEPGDLRQELQGRGGRRAREEPPQEGAADCEAGQLYPVSGAVQPAGGAGPAPREPSRVVLQLEERADMARHLDLAEGTVSRIIDENFAVQDSIAEADTFLEIENQQEDHCREGIRSCSCNTCLRSLERSGEVLESLQTITWRHLKWQNQGVGTIQELDSGLYFEFNNSSLKSDVNIGDIVLFRANLFDRFAVEVEPYSELEENKEKSGGKAREDEENGVNEENGEAATSPQLARARPQVESLARELELEDPEGREVAKGQAGLEVDVAPQCPTALDRAMQQRDWALHRRLTQPDRLFRRLASVTRRPRVDLPEAEAAPVAGGLCQSWADREAELAARFRAAEKMGAELDPKNWEDEEDLQPLIDSELEKNACDEETDESQQVGRDSPGRASPPYSLSPSPGPSHGWQLASHHYPAVSQSPVRSPPPVSSKQTSSDLDPSTATADVDMMNEVFVGKLENIQKPMMKQGGKPYPSGPSKVDLSSDAWRDNLINHKATKLIIMDTKGEIERRREEAKINRAEKEKVKMQKKDEKDAQKKRQADEKEAKKADRAQEPKVFSCYISSFIIPTVRWGI
jgi:hypothetical protein